jgi:hypothetical protein
MPDDSPGGGKSIPFAGDLSDLEKLLGGYFASSTVGLCILDFESRYLAINNTLATMNGAPAPDHLGKTAREVLGEFSDQVEPNFWRALSTGSR